MHRCLEVEEIVELITQWAEDIHWEEWWAVRDPKPSVVVAQTCRAFYEPGCNVRWRELPSFDPLLRVFLANRNVALKRDGPVSLEVRRACSASEPRSLTLVYCRSTRPPHIRRAGRASSIMHAESGSSAALGTGIRWRT